MNKLNSFVQPDYKNIIDLEREVFVEIKYYFAQIEHLANERQQIIGEMKAIEQKICTLREKTFISFESIESIQEEIEGKVFQGQFFGAAYIKEQFKLQNQEYEIICNIEDEIDRLEQKNVRNRKAVEEINERIIFLTKEKNKIFKENKYRFLISDKVVFDL